MAVIYTFSSATSSALNGMWFMVNGVRKFQNGDVVNSGDLVEIIPSSTVWLVVSASFAVGGVDKPFSSDLKTRSKLTYQTGDEVLGTFKLTYSNVGSSMFMTYTADILADIAAKGCKMYRNNDLVLADWQTRSKDVMKLVCDPEFNIGANAPFWSTAAGTAYPMTVNTARTEATRTLSGTNITWPTFTLETVQAAPPPVWTVTQANLTQFDNNNAFLFKNNVRAVVGTQFNSGDTVKFTPDRALRRLQNTWLNSTDAGGAYERLTLVQNADKSEAVYTLTSQRAVTSVIVTTEARPVPYTVKQADIDAYTNGQAKLFINDVAAVVGSPISTGDVLLAIANPGRVFTNNSVWYQASGGTIVYFDQNEDFTEATNTVALQISGMFSVSTVLAPSPDVRGLNNVYKVTQNQLKSITQERFEVNQQGQVVDYGNYIIGLIELPFKTDSVYDVGEQDVQLGPKKTDIAAILLDRDIIRLNLGVIHVPSVKNNFLDYKNTTALIHLPYCEPINIDMEYVIDQDVTIDYIINLYDGTATINITSSKTGEIVITQNIDMGIVVPFANVDSFPTKNDPRSIKLGSDNGIETAFIEILRNESILENGFFTIPVVDETTLSTYTGFAQVEQINLKSKATSFEKDLIISQLRDGVIIK